jgi:hypothetical protein
MSTIPVPAEEVARIVVSLATAKLAAVLVPKYTAVELVKPEPVMVTAVPPVAKPAVGAMLETIGSVAAETLLVKTPAPKRTTIAAKNPEMSDFDVIFFIFLYSVYIPTQNKPL